MQSGGNLAPTESAGLKDTLLLGGPESPDYSEFKRHIHRKTGIDLDQYKPQQMYRRLSNLMERAGVHDFTAYYTLLERDADLYALFLDRLTINVSELFRNPEKWQELREKILPPLLAPKCPLKVWSAGCSYGAEPYSLAILLAQVAPGPMHVIHATDLDRTILEKARAGRFTQADVKNVDAPTLARYFNPLSPQEASLPLELDARYQVNDRIRSKVIFRAQNLLADPFENGYDLICCRNVVIYFTEPAKDRLFARFYDALKPGGLLFVGGTERIFQFREIGFDTPLPFFYRRI